MITQKTKSSLAPKKYHFVSGLPRSGSTVLCNILAQNPKFRCDAVTSGLLDVLIQIRDTWGKIRALQTWDYSEAKVRVMRAAFHAFYSDSEHPIVFDKCRGWPAHIELAELLTGSQAKIIVCVRDMREIMASWEKLWRKTKATENSTLPLEIVYSVESRVRHWGSPTEPTGMAFQVINDALKRGFEDRLLFVEFGKFTRAPREQMERIYQFIEEPYFNHNFNQIDQRNLEKDPHPWMKDLHLIRQELQPIDSNWREILGPQADGLADSNRIWIDRV